MICGPGLVSCSAASTPKRNCTQPVLHLLATASRSARSARTHHLHRAAGGRTIAVGTRSGPGSVALWQPRDYLRWSHRRREPILLNVDIVAGNNRLCRALIGLGHSLSPSPGRGVVGELHSSWLRQPWAKHGLSGRRPSDRGDPDSGENLQDTNPAYAARHWRHRLAFFLSRQDERLSASNSTYRCQGEEEEGGIS